MRTDFPATQACLHGHRQASCQSGSKPGQPALAGLQAADNVIFMRESIESVSRRHGLVSSFLPKVDPNWAGSGAHTHISIQDREGRNLMAQLLQGLQEDGSIAESFVAGKG